MVSAILKIISELLPWLLGLFNEEARARRENEAFDKAVAGNDHESISRLLSERFDRVRAPGHIDNTGLPGDSGSQ
jgi:hypothetical protein